MKLELNTSICPIITPDTYGTGFSNSVAADCWNDFRQLMIEIAETYIDEALQTTDFAAAKLTMGNMYSPREYNFDTDRITFELEFDERMKKVIENKVNDEFFAYANVRFGSYEGFYSFYPVKSDVFYRALKEQNGRLDLAVSIYLMWQIEKEIDLENYERHYLDEVWDTACANGYEVMEDEDAL